MPSTRPFFYGSHRGKAVRVGANGSRRVDRGVQVRWRHVEVDNRGVELGELAERRGYVNLLWLRVERSMAGIPGVIFVEICKKFPAPNDSERQCNYGTDDESHCARSLPPNLNLVF